MTEDTRQETIERGTDEAQRANFDEQEKQTSQTGDIFDPSLERIDWALDIVRKNKEKVPDDRSKKVLEMAEERLLKARERLLNIRDKIKPLIPQEKEEEINSALEIYQRGPANHKEMIDMVYGLSFEERRQAELITKYGKGFGGVFLARSKAFFAGELDSHLISGTNVKQDWAEKTQTGEVLRKGIISVFNRQNAPAAAVAVAIGVLTGGIGAPAAGVLMGGSMGRFSAELFASRHEGNARLSILETEREHWLRLKELAAAYRAETDPEAQKIKFQTFLDEYYLANETSVSRQKFQSAENNFIEVSRRWGGIKNICQSLGGVAGLGGGVLWGHLIGYFAGIKGGFTVVEGQKILHGAQRINGIWNFIGKAGEVVGNQTVPSGQIVYHVMNAANPAAAEIASRIYIAAAIKALPTLGALCLAGLRHLKTKKYGKEAMNQFTYFNQSWQTERRTRLGSQTEPQAESRDEAQAVRQEPQRTEVAPEGVMTREQTLDDSDNNDWRLSRRTAMIILGRIQNYAELNADTQEERKKLFIEKAKELLKKEITVHWRGEKNPKDKARSDLDGETALYLLRQAVGEDIIVKYEPHGKFNEGHLNIDTGERHGITFEPEPEKIKNGLIPNTAFIDHHGAESWVNQSAAFLTYETLINLGLLERSERLAKLVEFVNNTDDMTGPFVDPAHFARSHRTIAGLCRSVSPRRIFEFFEKDRNPDPTRELNEVELRKYGAIFKDRKDGSTVNLSEKQRKNNEEAEKAVAVLEAKNKVIQTPYGKLLIDEGSTVQVPSAALSKGYIHLKYDENGFFISGIPRELELPEGRRMRNMWMHRKKPTISLDDIISVFTKSALAKAA